ncbi:hypothetical protein BC827DRAFT_1243361 [Russula dissimulans]|nr:hypothetical protein BC827DRAFT_1243361 [Russula dissimulans]
MHELLHRLLLSCCAAVFHLRLEPACARARPLTRFRPCHRECRYYAVRGRGVGGRHWRGGSVFARSGDAVIAVRARARARARACACALGKSTELDGEEETAGLQPQGAQVPTEDAEEGVHSRGGSSGAWDFRSRSLREKGGLSLEHSLSAARSRS